MRKLQITRICRSTEGPWEAAWGLEPALPGSAELSSRQRLCGPPLGIPPRLQPDDSLRTFPLTYCHSGVPSVWPQYSAPSDAA